MLQYPLRNMKARIVLAWMLCIFLGFVACSDDSEENGTSTSNTTVDAGSDTSNTEDVETQGDTTLAEDTTVTDDRRVITADWLNRSLTVFEYSALVSDPEAAIRTTIDLSDHSPGPLQLELTPDGKEAIVSVGPGFFDGPLKALVGASNVPPGGTLLIVDLESGVVRAEIETAHVPMGIAVSPDGRRAYTANFGTQNAQGNTMSIIDLEAGTLVEDVMVGSSPEQVVLDPSGAIGLINLAGNDGIKAFETGDVSGTLSALVSTGNDPSDIAFVGGSEFAVVVNSQSIDAVLLDMRTPSMPSVVSTLTLSMGLPYGVDAIPGSEKVLMTVSSNPSLLRVADTSGATLKDDGSPIELAGRGFPLNTAVDAAGEFAFVPHAIDGTLSIVNLADNSVQSVQWLEQSGPTYVVVRN